MHKYHVSFWSCNISWLSSPLYLIDFTCQNKKYIYTYIYIYIHIYVTRKRLEAYQRMQKKKGWGRRTAMWCFYPHHPISGGWWLDLGIDQAEKSSPPATRREHVVAHEGHRGSLLWCQRQCSGSSTHQISSKDHNLLDATRHVTRDVQLKLNCE